MKRARIFHQGRIVWGEVVDGDQLIRLPDGECVTAASAVWLPPVMPGATIFALGLNYADHSAELGFKAPTTPLVFLKGTSTFLGHGGVARKPADAEQMHPECELVAVIGRQARRVSSSHALDHVAGYTVACDYAVREFLENYYRPNLRVKNRDAATPIGPWIVDAEDVGDPQSLSLGTWVNGEECQHGSTSDMVFSVAELIAYLSGFMTLQAGDMILTGTPHGVRFVRPGDTVTCSVERIGSVTHTVEEAA